MLFAVMGFLKSVGDRPSGRSQAEMNDHLACGRSNLVAMKL
jgi:hypothetical protein